MSSNSSLNMTKHTAVQICTNMEDGKLKLACLVINAIISVLGIVMNAVVIAVYRKNKQLKTKSNVIIATMAMVSIPLAVLEFVCSLVHMVNSRAFPYTYWLKIVKCIEAVLGYFIIQATTLMSIQRRSIISNINRPTIQTNVKKMKLILLATVLYTSAITLPLSIADQTVWLNITFYIGCHHLKVNKAVHYYRIGHFLLVSFVPSCLVIGIYSYIQNQIQRKSGTLHMRPGRESLKRGSVRRVDRQSSLTIVVIVVFFILFHFPREVMTLQLIIRKQLEEKRWLYLVTITLSNMFQQFSSLVHVCTSTRYRMKMRQSFARTEQSAQTRESGISTRRLPYQNSDKRKVVEFNNEQGGKNIKSAAATEKKLCCVQLVDRRSSSRQNHSNTNGSFPVRYVVQREATVPRTRSSTEKSPRELSAGITIMDYDDVTCAGSWSSSGRRFTDSELVIKKNLQFIETLRRPNTYEALLEASQLME